MGVELPLARQFLDALIIQKLEWSRKQKASVTSKLNKPEVSLCTAVFDGTTPDISESQFQVSGKEVGQVHLLFAH